MSELSHPSPDEHQRFRLMFVVKFIFKLVASSYIFRSLRIFNLVLLIAKHAINFQAMILSCMSEAINIQTTDGWPMSLLIILIKIFWGDKVWLQTSVVCSKKSLISYSVTAILHFLWLFCGISQFMFSQLNVLNENQVHLDFHLFRVKMPVFSTNS